MTDAHYTRISAFKGLVPLIIRYAGEEGLERVFARQSLPLELLDTLNAIIPMKDLHALYRNAAEVTALRSPVLDALRDFDSKDFGIFGNFVAQAPDLRRAFVRLQNLVPYYARGSRLTLQENGDEFIIGYENVYQNAVGFHHVSGGLLRIVQGVVREFAGTNWTPRRVLTPFSKGICAQDFEDAFSTTVTFGQDNTAMVLDRDLVGQAMNTSDAGGDAVVSFADVQRMGADLPTDFAGVVAHLVSLRLATGRFSIENISEELALGPRTVQRRLDTHGINYRQLVTSTRMQRARELLSGSGATINRISHDIGYSETASFTRAFIKTHGFPPSELRRA